MPEAAAGGYSQGKKRASKRWGSETFLRKSPVCRVLLGERVLAMVLHLDEEQTRSRTCSSTQKNGQLRIFLMSKRGRKGVAPTS